MFPSRIPNRRESFVAAILLGFFLFNAQIMAQKKDEPAEKMTVEDHKRTVEAELDALKSHVTGEAPLDAATIEEYTTTIDANKEVIGRSVEVDRGF